MNPPHSLINAPHQDQRDAMLKLAVVLPALNEESTVGHVIAAVPRQLPGVREVEVILVDDGSTDATVSRALAAGADRIARHARNRGLVAAFSRGITEALHAGADIVVHLDSDGQHDPEQIPELIAPIIAGEADIVVGVRPLAQATNMTLAKRIGNRVGSWIFRRLLRLPVSDFTSGYRALSREALLRLNLVSDYTYTLESLIQAARMRLAVTEVVVPVRERSVGDSRMAGSVTNYIARAGGQALRCLLHAKPLSAFGRAAALMMLIALSFTAWFLTGYQSGGLHLPALLAALLAFVMSVGLFVSGLVADGIGSNRRLLEDLLYRMKALEAHTLAGLDDTADDLQGTKARLSEIA
jgi:glycosyltransferase involved in cell wall biosynthesis